MSELRDLQYTLLPKKTYLISTTITIKEDNKQESQSKEAEEYSESVKKRIAKLTKKMREAERQREEALRYAESVKKERDEFCNLNDHSIAEHMNSDYFKEILRQMFEVLL